MQTESNLDVRSSLLVDASLGERRDPTSGKQSPQGPKQRSGCVEVVGVHDDALLRGPRGGELSRTSRTNQALLDGLKSVLHMTLKIEQQGLCFLHESLGRFPGSRLRSLVALGERRVGGGLSLGRSRVRSCLSSFSTGVIAE
jgi:hypothetical protein